MKKQEKVRGKRTRRVHDTQKMSYPEEQYQKG